MTPTGSVPTGATSRSPVGADSTRSKSTEMWTRPNTPSGEFRGLRRRGVSFRNADDGCADSTGRWSLVALVVWGATAVVSVAFVLAAVFVK